MNYLPYSWYEPFKDEKYKRFKKNLKQGRRKTKNFRQPISWMCTKSYLCVAARSKLVKDSKQDLRFEMQ